MTIAYLGESAAATTLGASSTVGFFTSADCNVGDCVFLYECNCEIAVAPFTTSVSDASGNKWTLIVQRGGPSADTNCSIWMSYITTFLPSGSLVNVAFSSGISITVGFLMENFSGLDLSVDLADQSAATFSTTTAVDTGAASHPNRQPQSLLLRAGACDASTTWTDTSGYTPFPGSPRSSGTGSGDFAYKIVNQGQFTRDQVTLGAAASGGIVVAVLPGSVRTVDYSKFPDLRLRR